jgi:hypothetical protein
VEVLRGEEGGGGRGDDVGESANERAARTGLSEERMGRRGDGRGRSGALAAGRGMEEEAGTVVRAFGQERTKHAHMSALCGSGGRRTSPVTG